MLSDSQINFVMFVFVWAFEGLIIGGLCGLFVAPAARVLKTRNPVDLLTGFVLGVFPGVMVASTVALSIAIFMTAAFQPGCKFGYEAPDWFASTAVCLVVAAGGFASCSAARRDLYFESLSRTILHVLLWGLGGGILASFVIACLGFVFSQGSSGPLLYAILGFVFGSAIAVVWRLGIAALGRCQPPAGKHKAQSVP